MRRLDDRTAVSRADQYVRDLIHAARSARDLSKDRETALYWFVVHECGQLARARARRGPARWALTGIATIAATFVIFLAGMPAGTAPRTVALSAAADPRAWAEPPSEWTETRVSGIGLLEHDAAAALETVMTPTAWRVKMASGRLRAEVMKQDPARPVVVEAPGLKVIVIGTRFDVSVAEGKTTVDLLHGRVRVESPHGFAILEAGESIRSDDPRLAPPPSESIPLADVEPPKPVVPRAAQREEARAESTEDCAAIESRPGRLKCLSQVAEGTGLAAENALYLLGLGAPRDDEALRAFDAYDRRFPEGLHGREIALRRLGILWRKGRADEAVAAAKEFENRFGTDPRAVEMKRVREGILPRL